MNTIYNIHMYVCMYVHMEVSSNEIQISEVECAFLIFYKNVN